MTSDEPSDISTGLDDYDDWLNHTWNHPCLDRGLTTVVAVDGQVAAFTLAHTDGATRYLTAMTGTRRAFRGRGLAKLAKTDSSIAPVRRATWTRTPRTTGPTARCWRSTGGSATRSARRKYATSAPWADAPAAPVNRPETGLN